MKRLELLLLIFSIVFYMPAIEGAEPAGSKEISQIKSSQEKAPETPANQPASNTPRDGTKPSAGRMKKFVPTEKIPADSAISFPADI